MRVFDCWHFHLPIFASLFGTVHCPFSPRELAHTSPVHPHPWHDTLCHYKPPYIFLKAATIPTYQGISIAFPRYIVTPQKSGYRFLCCYSLLAFFRPTFFPWNLVYDQINPGKYLDIPKGCVNSWR